MPFEPLGTDEPLTEENAPPPRDFEMALAGGCSVALLGSLAIFLLTIWPFFVIPEQSVAGLRQILLWGGVPSTLLGILLVRIFQTPGLSAYGGGAMCAALFMWLRLSQTMLRNADASTELPPVEYSPAMAYLLPLGWVLLAAILIAIFFPRERSPKASG